MKRMNNAIKSCLAAVVMVVTGVAGMAQQQTMPQFGIRASFDMTTSSKMTEMTNFGPGGSVGFSYMSPFGKMAFFQGSLYLAYNTVQYKGTTANASNPIKIDGHIDVVGLKLPLDIGLFCVNNDKFRLSVYTGPRLFFNFSTTGQYYEILQGDAKYHDDKMTNSGMDIGWGLGVGVDFNRRWHFHVEGVYGLSNTCVVELMNDEIRRAGISVGVG